MDSNRPRATPSQGRQSPQTKAPRDDFIQQYVQAARERLEAINASMPSTANNSTTSVTQLPPKDEPALPPQAVAEYAKNPSSSTQWPLKAPSQEQPHQAPRQPATKPKVEHPKPPRQSNRPPQGPQTTQIPIRSTQRIEDSSQPKTAPRGPPPRGYRGQPPRHPPGQGRVPPPPRRAYYPPPNVDPPHASRPLAASLQQPKFAPPANPRSVPAQGPSAKNFPTLSEEVDTRKSTNSSVMTSNTLDVLSEYSDDAGSDIPNRSSAVNSSDRAGPPSVPPSSSGTGIVRQASVGHVQKPIITNIPASARTDGVWSTDDQEISPVESSKTPTDTMFQNAPVTPIAASSSGFQSSKMPQVPTSAITMEADPPLAIVPPIQAPSSPNLKESQSPLMSLDSKFNQTSPKPVLTKQTSKDVLRQPENQSPNEPVDSGVSSPTQIPPSSGSGGVRDSTTSLRGLIVRNMRLASNLEQGKTSSKFGIDWILNGGGNGGAKRASQGSMSSMIDNFPTTPKNEKSRSLVGDDFMFPDSKYDDQSPVTSDSRDARVGDAEKNGESKRSKRQCCWMPLWLFIILVIGVILLIAAAIIIPVALIVIPNQSQSAPSPTHTVVPTTSDCGKILQCSNGGSAEMSASGACYCLCASPWTGRKCTTQDASCVSIKTSKKPNAAIGSDLAPIVAKSGSAFDIHLDAATLLEIFGSANMSCSSENELVSFDSVASNRVVKARAQAYANQVIRRVPSRVKLARPNKVAPRQETTNGIIYAPTASPATTASTTTNTPTTTETPVSSWGTSTKAVDFASTATLYILQFTHKLPIAESAKSKLEGYLQRALADGSVYSGTNVDLGNGWKADFTSWTVFYDGMGTRL